MKRSPDNVWFCSNTLLSNVDNNNYSIEIVMEDIAAEDEDLHDALNSSPNEFLPAVSNTVCANLNTGKHTALFIT